MRLWPMLLAGCALATAPAHAAPLLGVNLGGLEAAGTEGKLGWSHVPPSAEDIDLAIRNGVRLFRIPIRHERLRPTIGGALDGAEVAALKGAVDRILKTPGTVVVVDNHSFGMSYGAKVGAGPWSPKAIAETWRAELEGLDRLDDPRVMVEIDNEPHNAGTDWWPAVKRIVPELRRIGIGNTLVVSGDEYSGASSWTRVNGPMAVETLALDPKRAIVFDAHTYFDANGSGTSAACAAGSEARVDPVIEHAEQHGYRVMLGEIAWSADDSCDAVRAATIAKIKASKAIYGITAWTLGGFYPWPNYVFGLTGVDRKPSIVFEKLLADWRK